MKDGESTSSYRNYAVFSRRGRNSTAQLRTLSCVVSWAGGGGGGGTVVAHSPALAKKGGVARSRLPLATSPTLPYCTLVLQ